MPVIESLGNDESAPVVPAVKESRPASVPDGLPGSVDVFMAATVEHPGDTVAHGDLRLHPDRWRLAAGRRKSAVQNGPFGHVDRHRAQSSVAPRYVPKKKNGENRTEEH